MRVEAMALAVILGALACASASTSEPLEPGERQGETQPAQTPEAQPQPLAEPRPGVLESSEPAPQPSASPRRECPQMDCPAACVVKPESGDGCPTCDCEESTFW